MNTNTLWTALLVAGLVAGGAAAREAPSFGLRVPPPAAPLFGLPPAPTANPNVFVREAPGTSQRFSGGPSLIYRAPGAPLPPAPPFTSIQQFAGHGSQTMTTRDGRPFGYLDLTRLPRATVTLTAPNRTAARAYQHDAAPAAAANDKDVR